MKKTSIQLTTKKIMQKIEKENILFSHWVQRKEDQWILQKKSLLIHSLICDFPIPPIYTYSDDEGNYQVLDGKQRLTTIHSFIKGEFTLTDVPEVVLETGEEYEVNGLKFDELQEALKDEIYGASLTLYIFNDCSEDEVSEIFFRLNNGESLTRGQQTRAKLGTQLIEFVDDTLKLPFFKEKAKFTKVQLKKSEDETCLLQTLMLLTDYKYKKFGADDILDFVESYRENCDMSELNNYKNIFIKLNECFNESHKLLKKIHIPMFAVALKTSEDMGIEFYKFKEWINNFVDNYDTKSQYSQLCSGSTTNREKVVKRLDLINNSLLDFVTQEVM